MLAIDNEKSNLLVNLFRSQQPTIVAANSSYEEIIDTVLFYFSMALFNGDKFLKQSHPDIFILGQQASQFSIDDVRRAEEFVSKANIELKTQLIIVYDICKVTISQANALLKLIEESASKDYIIVFISIAPVSVIRNIIQGVLSTIMSRCFLVFLAESFTEASTKDLLQHNQVHNRLNSWQYRRLLKPNAFVNAMMEMERFCEDLNA